MPKRKPVRTHTFRYGVYRIEEALGADGVCDVPDNRLRKTLDMMIYQGNSLRALRTAIHESMHAEGVPDRFVHGLTPDRIASFLWRLGWRRR